MIKKYEKIFFRYEDNMEKLYIVIPAYNEEVMIRSVIEHWYPVVQEIGEDSRLVIIDDGSRDDTYKIVKECMQQYPQLIALTKQNQGHGPTVRFGYEYAVEAGADYVFQTDSDGQTLAEEFPEFWKRRNEGDMIIGHRNHREDGWGRVAVTKVLKLVIGLIFHVNVTDANTPYRLMQADALKKVLPIIPKDYNLSNVLVSVIFVKKDMGVKFLPITFRPRQGGVNSINVKKIFKLGVRALSDFYKLSKVI